MNDLLLFLYMSPPLIAFVLLYIVCHFAKKHNIKRKQQEREHRQALRCIARDRELDEQLKFEFTHAVNPQVVRANENTAKIIEYVQKNLEV